MHPAEITSILRIEPDISWVAGEQRKTPTGTPLKGVYKESYWYALLLKNDNNKSADDEMEDHLFQLAQKLDTHKTFFRGILSDGGRADIVVATDGQQNYEIILSPELLQALSNSCLRLIFDIFPYPQNR